MTTEDRWLLPEGIEESLPAEAERLEALRRELLDLYHRWGYELVRPPLIEYLESLLTGTGHDLDLQTFKLTDQLSGRLMGVRADMTPQVARIDSHRLKRDAPVRLCYMGTVLRTRPDGLSSSRSPMQVGAELYGHAGVESDLEIGQLMLETLARTGIGPVYLDLGHVGIFRGLARHAGLDEADEAELFAALQRKARPDIARWLDARELPARARGMLEALADLNGGWEVLDEARRALKRAPREVHAAIDYLERLARGLCDETEGVELHFDLAELRGYNYHTGVVFAAYTPGHGQDVARGGRYDEIGRVFGRARPATGFSTDLKALVALAGTESPGSPGGIFAPAEEDARLRERVRELRAAGERVIVALPGQSAGATELGCDRVLVRRDGDWVVAPLE